MLIVLKLGWVVGLLMAVQECVDEIVDESKHANAGKEEKK